MATFKWRTVLSAALAGSMLLGGCGAVNAGLASGQTGGFQAEAKRGPARGGFTPKWVKDAVFYQIFPERFANGNPANDPKGSKPWGSTPENFNYMGGDLAGVKQKLPYLKALGINAIYFNPLFKADSNHKYNTTDYFQIDPEFGTNAEFKALLDECHRQGIKVILDAVFNHTGDKSPMFQDCIQNGPKSKYWSFYNIYSFPVTTEPKPNYDAWWGFGTLPKLMVKNNPDVQNYLYSVADYWTKQGIDGWRLDVPNELDSDKFWQGFRQHVRAINPNAYIVGEIWEDGSHWLQGDQFDAVMNYQFRAALLDFFAYQKISVDELDGRLADIRNRYGADVTDAEFNILGSHDVARLLTECGGNAGRMKEAVFFQMVYPGAPVVYYGDELGQSGGKDPDNRRTMPWERSRNNDMLGFYQKLIAVRKAHPALHGGEFRTLMRHNDYRLFAFVRADENEKLVVALNSGKLAKADLNLDVSKDFKDGTVLVDQLSGKSFTVQGGKLAIAQLPSGTGVILAPQARR